MDNTLIDLFHSFCFEINAFLNKKKRTELICTPNNIFDLKWLFGNEKRKTYMSRHKIFINF